MWVAECAKLAFDRLSLTPASLLVPQAYSVYTVAFVLGVYCNMRALENSNVETVIIFRSCTPLAVAICDWIFLGRELPSRRSTVSLCTIGFGACP